MEMNKKRKQKSRAKRGEVKKMEQEKMEQEAVRRQTAPDSVSRGGDTGDNSAGGSGGVITDSLSRTAMQLFAGNEPMALGYMVGKVGLED